MDSMSETVPQTFVELEQGSEWRFELEADEDIAVRVSLHAYQQSSLDTIEGSYCVHACLSCFSCLGGESSQS
jgi:hypothetical protein